MSLEAAIAGLTEALTINNELLKAANTSRAEAMDMLSSKTKAEPASEKPIEKAAEPAPEKRRGRLSKDAKPAAPTVEEVRAVFGDYMAVDDIPERDRRGENVRAILNEIGAQRATEIPEDRRAEAIAWVNDLKAGKKLNFMADANESSDLI